MVENTTYITKAEPAEQQEKRAEEILRDMLSSPLFFMCAVLVTLNAVISVIVGVSDNLFGKRLHGDTCVSCIVGGAFGYIRLSNGGSLLASVYWRQKTEALRCGF